MKKVKSGFTLVEIMIVVAIIGLLAAIAIPSFVKARETARKNSCINNLRLIDHAKEQWALAESKNNGDDVVDAEINTYIRGGTRPVCPSAGTYTFGVVGAPPTCTVTGHVLP